MKVPAAVAQAEKLPFDYPYFRSQLSGAVGFQDPQGWYLRHGLRQRVNPTPFFLTDWYAWQNPDWTSFDAPYLHYLHSGRREGRDPSPFVDVSRFLQVAGTAIRPVEVYEMILRGYRSKALGVYETSDDLRRSQAEFLDAISCTTARSRRPEKLRKSLVVLQAGPGSLARSWYDEEAPTEMDESEGYMQKQ